MQYFSGDGGTKESGSGDCSCIILWAMEWKKGEKLDVETFNAKLFLMRIDSWYFCIFNVHLAYKTFLKRNHLYALI